MLASSWRCSPTTSTSPASQVFSYRYWRYSCGRSYSAQPSAASWAFTSRASISPDPTPRRRQSLRGLSLRRWRHILDRATHRPHRPPREHSRSSRPRPQHCCPSSSREHPRSVTDRWINKSRVVGHSAKVSGRRPRISQRATNCVRKPSVVRTPAVPQAGPQIGHRRTAGPVPMAVSSRQRPATARGSRT